MRRHTGANRVSDHLHLFALMMQSVFESLPFLLLRQRLFQELGYFLVLVSDLLIQVIHHDVVLVDPFYAEVGRYVQGHQLLVEFVEFPH